MNAVSVIRAICWKCGNTKPHGLVRCQSCGVTPISRPERVRSLALTSRFMTPPQMQILAEDIRAQRRLDIPVDVLGHAEAALPEGEATLTALHPREVATKARYEGNPTIPYSIPAGGNPGPADWARRIIELAGICEGFTGWAEAGSADELEAELNARRRHYRDILVSALDQLPSQTLLEAVTLAVKSATREGRTRAPGLLEDLIGSYELRARAALDKGAGAIRELMSGARTAAEESAEASQARVSQLQRAAREWKAIVRPIELVAESRGEPYASVRQLAEEMRGFAADIATRPVMAELSSQVVVTLDEVFPKPDELQTPAPPDTGLPAPGAAAS